MAEPTNPGWFANTFGDQVTGTKWGAVTSIVGGGLLGWLFGKGVVGAAIGAAGGAFLAPMMNELFHKMFPPTMPSLPTTIARVPVIQEMQVQVQQPGNNPPAQRVVASPILETLEVPPSDGVMTTIQLSEQLRTMLSTGTGTAAEFDTLARQRATLATSLATFYTNMRTYQGRQHAYHDPSGSNPPANSHAALLNSVTALSGSLSNPLSPQELVAFVPRLPSVDDIFDEYPQFAQGQTLGAIQNLYTSASVNTSNLNIETLAMNFYTNGGPPHRRYFNSSTPPVGTVDGEGGWNTKNYIEKMNIALMALDDRFGAIAYGGTTRLDWTKIGNYQKWSNIIQGELNRQPPGNVSQALIAEADRMRNNIPPDIAGDQQKRSQYLANLDLVESLAPVIHAREELNRRLVNDFQPLLTELGTFRNTELTSAHANAHSFVEQRLAIFNDQHIAIFANGRVPGNPERYYVSYKDGNTANAPTRTLVGSMVNGQFSVTHQFEGIGSVSGNDFRITANPGSTATTINDAAWTSAAMNPPRAIDRNAFVTLGNGAGAILRNFLTSAGALLVQGPTNGQPQVAAAPTHNNQLVALAEDFRTQSEGQPPLTVGLQGGTNVNEHSQPTGIPRRVVTGTRANNDEMTSV